ncbi:MAG: bifunctional glutamate--cysteine ligase GshA/glutathione synthetase GshB [Bacteroidales bacterium]
MERAIKKVKRLILNGKFGIEKENLRITADGHLALTPHPDSLGNKGDNPYITTDFSESQIEMITPPLNSIAQALGFMETINDIVSENIGNELLWPQSLPPLLPEENLIPIARYSEEDKELEAYRTALAEIYGKKRQLISGIHFNFSLSDEWFEEVIKHSETKYTLREYKEHVYMKMMRNFMRFRWIYIWLFGETPVAEESFRVPSLSGKEERVMKSGLSISLRNGPLGYRNKEEFYMDYSSPEHYKAQIEQLVSDGRLLCSKELYMPFRIKFLEKDNGAPSYVEVRLIDLDPLSRSGVSAHALYFTHILLLYSLLKDEDTHFNSEEQFIANRKQDFAASFGRCLECRFPYGASKGHTVWHEAGELLNDIYHTLEPYTIWSNQIYQQQWNYVRSLVTNPDLRPGIIVYNGCKEKGFLNYHLEKAAEYKQESKQKGFRFHGLEDMELSTQLLLKAAIRRGVHFEILDRKENFIRLFNKEKEEYVIQATKTSLDNYASVLIMENKVVTKKVLDRHHIRTPEGREYTDPMHAMSDFHYFGHESVVVKPKSTNFGLGITILKHPYKREDFEAALEIAFDHDNTILIEKFVPGREFRFLVIDHEVAGVLHRVPANVSGDGVSTVRQLIEKKNMDPLRGKGYKTPLEKIATGREEELFLHQQGLKFESVPAKDQVVYLRENSNISTGGDSIDFTDEVGRTYKQIAVTAAEMVNARICGVDMMIQDIYEPAGDHNYAIIELNFNPAIHIHCFPYRGKDRKANEKILNALGF